MNLAILTLGSRSNYGGVLQNFALQKALKKEGFHATTINCLMMPPVWRLILSKIKSFLLYVLGKPRMNPYAKKRSFFAEDFIKHFVEMTEIVFKLDDSFLKKHSIDCIIVGSDQVWRPIYNCRLEDMYLKFARNSSVKRIAYAASFGVDHWEYTTRQTSECGKLAKKFSAISVREKSGVELCNKYLGVNASWVLDPTLLLDKEDYIEVCQSVPVLTGKILVAYILDMNGSVRELCESVAKERGLDIKIFRADAEATLTVPEWLGMFRDADYVITDSFHGTVFSIIFGKEFKCIYNESRGSARFESLLNLYNSGKIDEMRDFSLNWLKNALET